MAPTIFGGENSKIPSAFKQMLWNTEKLELTLKSFKMKILEKGEIKQMTFVCLTAFISKAKCPFIIPNNLCFLTGVDTGDPGIQFSECNGWCVVDSLLAQSSVCVSLLALNEHLMGM